MLGHNHPMGKAKTLAAEPAAPAKRGRPTDYDPAFCELVEGFGKEGYSKAEMAAGLGVTRGTMDAWMKAHPDFSNAVHTALEFSLAWWEGKSRTGIEKGGAFNAGLWGKAMSGRFPNEPYRERHEHAGPNGSPLQVHQMTDKVAALPAEKRAAVRAALKAAIGDAQP